METVKFFFHSTVCALAAIGEAYITKWLSQETINIGLGLMLFLVFFMILLVNSKLALEALGEGV